MNNGLQEKFLQLCEERNKILESIIKYKTYYDDNNEKFYEEKANGRKKHNRRTALEIDRSYICPYSSCEKHYGSEGSLNLHVKIKHGGGNKTDREKVAKQLLICKLKQQAFPEVEINLPPGVLEEAAREAQISVSNEMLKEIYDDAFLLYQKYIRSEKGQRDMIVFQQKYNTTPSFNFSL